MKISKVRGSKIPASGLKNKKALNMNEQFVAQLKENSSADELGPISEVASVGAVDSVVAIQEVPDASDKRARSIYRDYGRDLLDRLEQLRMGILAGIFSKEKLAELAHRLRERQKKTDDPILNEIIQDIELRAEVEVAKLTRNT